MTALFSIIGIAFLFGMRHATDPDHVVAVSTIVSREGSVRRASMLGLAWGLGHTVTIVAVGFLIIVFRLVLPPRAGLAMEFAVGLMLIFLGLKNLGGAFKWMREVMRLEASDHRASSGSHTQYNDDEPCVQAHPAVHGDHSHHSAMAALDRSLFKSELYQFVRPLLIGIVHGLAGSAAIALLVLTTIRSVPWAIAYLTVFGVGTVLGMMFITLTLGSTYAYIERRSSGISRHFSSITGAISMVFGLAVVYQIGFVDRLFLAQPHWIPR